MCRLICEIGINHYGDFKRAKTLIEHAKLANAWGVKFQYRNLENFYINCSEVGDEIVSAELRRNILTFHELRELHKSANDMGLKFGMSFFREEDLSQYVSNCGDPDFLKIPSAECLNFQLVRTAKKLTNNLFVSIGGHETSKVLEMYRDLGHDDIILMHCVANYPAVDGTQNLSKLSEISKYFTTGYSSHDENYINCIAAIALGAKYLERHLTIDKFGEGLDESSSSDLAEMKVLGDFCDNHTLVIGDALAKPNQGEIMNMQNLGIGLYAKKNVQAGNKVKLSDLLFRAPRTGLSLHEFETEFFNKPLKKEIAKHTALCASHYIKSRISEKEIDFARSRSLALPVRLHDIDQISQTIPVGKYEFHLSYNEVLNDLQNVKIKELQDIKQFSVHLPDYIPGNRILNPLSDDTEVWDISTKIIRNTVNFANRLSDVTGEPTPIVGSFSQKGSLSDCEFLDLLEEKILSNFSQRILPQWLPVNAWYFGGTVKIDAFSNERYIEMINKRNIPICMDISHLILSANSHNASWHAWLEKLQPTIEHWHLADASGCYSEGLFFGDGVFDKYAYVLAQSNMKVIEVWQGHFNGGDKFIRAIAKLKELDRE